MEVDFFDIFKFKQLWISLIYCAQSLPNIPDMDGAPVKALVPLLNAKMHRVIDTITPDCPQCCCREHIACLGILVTCM